MCVGVCVYLCVVRNTLANTHRKQAWAPAPRTSEWIHDEWGPSTFVPGHPLVKPCEWGDPGEDSRTSVQSYTYTAPHTVSHCSIMQPQQMKPACALINKRRESNIWDLKNRIKYAWHDLICWVSSALKTRHVLKCKLKFMPEKMVKNSMKEKKIFWLGKCISIKHTFKMIVTAMKIKLWQNHFAYTQSFLVGSLISNPY